MSRRSSIIVIGAPNAEIGETGEPLSSSRLGETLALPDGIRIWTSRGQEAFSGNDIGLAKFNAAKQGGNFAPELLQEDGDLFTGATASFIVVDVPNEQLGDEIKVFTTTAVPHKGAWSPVDRHANVLFPYVFLAENPALHDDAMNTVPQLMTGVAVDDNTDDGNRYTNQFPYILPVE